MDMITSWVDEEDKANATYDAIRGKSKQNQGGSNNNRDQGGRNNNYSGPNHKRKPNNTSRLSNTLQKTTRRRPLAASKTC
jgi:hypothetical protein